LLEKFNISFLTEGLKNRLSRQSGSVVICDQSLSNIQVPEISFDYMHNVHMGDPDIGSSIEFIADVAVGSGYNLDMNTNYTETTKNGQTALEVVGDKCVEFGLDQLNRKQNIYHFHKHL